MTGQKIAVKRFPESMAGQTVGLLSISPSPYDPDLRNVNIAAAVIGGQGAVVSRYLLHGESDRPDADRCARTSGFLAVRGLYAEIPPQDVFDPGVFADDVKTSARAYRENPEEIIDYGVGRVHLSTTRRRWLEDHSAFAIEIKRALADEGVDYAYPAIYYSWNAAMYSRFNSSHGLRYDFEYAQLADGRSQVYSCELKPRDVLLVDPAMAERTATLLSMVVEIETNLGVWLAANEELSGKFRFFTDMSQANALPNFISMRKMVSLLSRDVTRIKGKLDAPARMCPEGIADLAKKLGPGRKAYNALVRSLQDRQDDPVKAALIEEAKSLK